MTKRVYSRATLYPWRRQFAFNAETGAKIEALADQLGVNAQDVVRRAVDRGLPVLASEHITPVRSK